jgi:hypothetical protein
LVPPVGEIPTPTRASHPSGIESCVGAGNLIDEA